MRIKYFCQCVPVWSYGFLVMVQRAKKKKKKKNHKLLHQGAKTKSSIDVNKRRNFPSCYCYERESAPDRRGTFVVLFTRYLDMTWQCERVYCEEEDVRD